MASRASTVTRGKDPGKDLGEDAGKDLGRDSDRGLEEGPGRVIKRNRGGAHSEGRGEGRALQEGPCGGTVPGPDDFYLRHPRMDLGLRAKIFIPFEPLRGFREALHERERQAGVIAHVDLPPERQERISQVLADLVPGDTVRVTHHMGDRYGVTQGLVEELLASDEELVVAGRHVSFRDISAIEALDG